MAKSSTEPDPVAGQIVDASFTVRGTLDPA